MIDCREMLARFYDYLDSELTPVESREVAEHLKTCRACFERMEFERLFAEFIREAGQERVDAGPLKQRIKARLLKLDREVASKEEELFPPDAAPVPGTDVPLPGARGDEEESVGGRRIPLWSYVAVAAALILVAIPFFRSHRADRSAADMSILIALHTETRPDVQASDPEQLLSWLKQQAASDPFTREFARASCALKGMGVDSIWSHLYAETRGTALSIFAADRATFVRPPGMVKVRLDGHDFWTEQEGDYAVVIWECAAANVTCAAVARLESATLVHLADEALRMRENSGTT